MIRTANNLRAIANNKRASVKSFGEILAIKNYIPQKAKMLAWGIFLVFFIENGTLGLIPRELYFVYRNMRISDFLIYGLVIYSLFNVREFEELYKSKALILIKIILIYFFIQFVVSIIVYQQNFIEYFFRLKGVWMSTLIFPYLLLLKRKGFPYLVKLILPVAIVSNILYILSSVTGVAFLPDIGIEKTNLPGGLKVHRVYGGTFFGELFFLAFVFQWITNKFRLYQLFLAILFITPHILAFGRSAWIYLSFTIIMMLIWNSLKSREFKIILKQGIILFIFCGSLIYAFTKFVPQADYLTEAIEARVLQGQEDVEYKKGTFGTRLANIDALVNLWQRGNIFFGIGMHPMWVIKPVTEEEVIYVWGFSDVRWASVLAAYGLSGFLLAVIFQLYYGYNSIRILKKAKNVGYSLFFVLLLFSTMVFDTFINYSYHLFTVGLWGLSFSLSFYVANLVYSYEHPEG